MPTAFPTITASDMPGPVDWARFVAALSAGHQRPKADLADVFLGPASETLLSRAARIDGLGAAVKSVTAFAGNSERGLPTVHGAMTVFDATTGRVRAVIDSALVTNIKTVADSVLGATLLARPDSRSLLIVGTGTVGDTLLAAYPAILPGIDRITLWNRTGATAEQTAAAAGDHVTATTDLAGAVAEADIIACATMSAEPVLQGDWVHPGTHVDLIGAFRAEMREADDALITKSQVFVDSRDTTLRHIGELMIPLANGTLTEADIQGDLYDLCTGAPGRRSAEEITLFKNGGGAHLDLMIADAILTALDIP